MAIANVAHSSSPHYATANWFTKYYNFDNRMDMVDLDYFRYSTRLNTITYQGHYFSWNPGQSSFSMPHQNTGHWGPNVYEGVGAVRNGVMKAIRECNYSVHGGPAPFTSLGY